MQKTDTCNEDFSLNIFHLGIEHTYPIALFLIGTRSPVWPPWPECMYVGSGLSLRSLLCS